jgi:hypothetical protein
VEVAVVYRILGYVMVDEIVRMVLMNHLIVVQQIEHVRLVFGNVIMVDVLVQINDVMVLMIAGKFNGNESRRSFFLFDC